MNRLRNYWFQRSLRDILRRAPRSSDSPGFRRRGHYRHARCPAGGPVHPTLDSLRLFGPHPRLRPDRRGGRPNGPLISGNQPTHCPMAGLASVARLPYTKAQSTSARFLLDALVQLPESALGGVVARSYPNSPFLITYCLYQEKVLSNRLAAGK